MKSTSLAAATLLFVWLWLPMIARSQELPNAGPEHEVLKEMTGTWDSVMKFEGQPDSKGKMTYKMECGGLWLTSNYEGDFGGAPFQGKGLDSYDAKKKKYVSVWVDSMSTTPMLFEGDYDKAKKTLTMFSEYPGPDGKPAKYKSATTRKDNDHYVFQMFITAAGAEETLMMTIEYTRRK